MQTLKRRTKKNTPTDAPQVRGNCGLSLNKEETLSVANSKTRFNNPEVDQRQQAGGLKANVLVLSLEGKPLMPCSPAKARKLLKQGKAKAVKRMPFAIQLKFICENKTQDVTCGIDSGYSFIGFSLITDKKELISGEVAMDNKTSSRLTKKRMYRKDRRNKLRYRQPRFLNRKKEEKWLAPSVKRKINTHIGLVEKLAKWIPITKVIIELGEFDIQKIINPEISGIEYQQGDMYGYANLKAYVISREYGKCQLCEKEKGNDNWQLHHVIERKNGGTNKANNIALLHKKCHKKLHQKGIRLKANKQFKAETFMSIARKFILEGFKSNFPNTEVTFGYETKLRRNEIGLTKTHANDAFVIAGGERQKRCKSLTILQKHRNNRSLGQQRRGFAPSRQPSKA